MHKEWMLKYQKYNGYNGVWVDTVSYFDSKEDMINFVKNGNDYVSQEEIKVESAFRLEKLNNDIFM